MSGSRRLMRDGKSRTAVLSMVAILAAAMLTVGNAEARANTTPPLAEPTGSIIGSSDGLDVTDRFLVQYRTSVAMRSGLRTLNGEGFHAQELATSGPFVASVNATADEAELLRSAPGVVAVEPNVVFTTDATQSSPPWGLDRIDQRSRPLNNSYQYSATGAGVTAYILDSGLWLSHNEFAGRIPNYAWWDFGDGLEAWDCDGHGTHVTGTVAGTTYGVAKGVSIIPVRVLNCQGQSSSEIVVAGLDWVIDNHQAGVPAVANMSVGGPASSIVDSYVQALINDGVTVVAAAGNSGENTCYGSPGRVSAVITVGASDINDAIPWWSNYGPCNDLFAPGVGIRSAYNTSNSATATFDGTSMAAPHVTGAVALYLQSYPSATPSQVAAAINAATTVGVLTGTYGGDPNKLLYVEATVLASLTVGKNGTGGGTVVSTVGGINCGGFCSTAVDLGTEVTLYSYPAPGSVFTGWAGADCPGLGSCTFAMWDDTFVTATFAFSEGPSFVSLSPVRLMDSRPGRTTIDGVSAGIGTRGAGTVTELIVAGRGGVDGGANAVVLNVTVVGPAAPGYLTVFPCGTGQPNASNLNFGAGQTIPNAVTAKIGSSGRVCFFTSQATNLIVDVAGFYTHSPSFVSLNPARLMDTRPTGVTIDGIGAAIGLRPGGTVTELIVAGRGGVDVSANAVVLNVTVVKPLSSGFVIVFPCGTGQPNASSLNFVAGQTIPNSVTAKIGVSGKVCFFTSQTTNLIVDVAGSYPVSPSFVPLSPARLMDTRSTGVTIDGIGAGIGMRGAGTITELAVSGRGGVAGGAAAVVLNVTVNQPVAGGFATVFPCGTGQPNASNLNFIAGQTIPNAVTTQVGVNGRVCLYTSQAAHLIVDVAGYFTEE